VSLQLAAPDGGLLSFFATVHFSVGEIKPPDLEATARRVDVDVVCVAERHACQVQHHQKELVKAVERGDEVEFAQNAIDSGAAVAVAYEYSG
jgi:hypothetical protein